jgi:hypothetical protein
MLDAHTQEVVPGYEVIHPGELVIATTDVPNLIALRINTDRETTSISLVVDGVSSVLHSPGPFGVFGYDNSSQTFNGWRQHSSRTLSVSVQCFRGLQLQSGKSAKYELIVQFVNPTEVIMPKRTVPSIF